MGKRASREMLMHPRCALRSSTLVTASLGADAGNPLCSPTCMRRKIRAKQVHEISPHLALALIRRSCNGLISASSTTLLHHSEVNPQDLPYVRQGRHGWPPANAIIPDVPSNLTKPALFGRIRTHNAHIPAVLARHRLARFHPPISRNNLSTVASFSGSDARNM